MSSDGAPPGEPAPELLDGRLWVDGCFDFFHHGHAGAIVQARQLGDELYIGVHSDEAILENKGPTVMNLRERLFAVEACRWVTQSVPNAPYVTALDWVTHFGCRYVVHGDDITSDGSGEDCYRFVKAANRFKVVKRTPSISTTDLVGRMLLCTKTHFIRSLEETLAGREGPGTDAERQATGQAMTERMRLYATDETAKNPGVDVWFWKDPNPATPEASGALTELVKGRGPQIGQRVVYVDGGFDLFSSGHIAFLQRVLEAEETRARADGWYEPEAVAERKGKAAGDYPPVFVVAGVHDDEVINEWKGVNYPIMNIYERGLCVLQCRVSTRPFLLSSLYTANVRLVHQRCRLWRTVLTDTQVPVVPPLGHSRRRLPRPYGVHSTHLRPVHRAQGHGHLRTCGPPRVFRRQCRHDCRPHPS